MSHFVYFKEGDSVEENGQIHCVPLAAASPYFIRKLDGEDIPVGEGQTPQEARVEAEAAGVEFKFKPSNFSEFWSSAVSDDTKALYTEGAAEGTFKDAEGVVRSLEDGEPVEAGDQGSDA